ncbi:MAG: DUF642 domain-containing protein [Alphaproteobacteria bacterium]|nr:DUF642 domain-containing protein [Alphaproteobacteria bacterium]MBV9061715.1 DUF642 domain-containing protein [Alphaproteobacteria bacterium]
MMLRHACAAAVAALMVSPAYAAGLVKDPSFEKPVVPDGGDQEFTVGQTFNGWTVIGETNVAVVSGDQTSGGFTLPAKKGVQWLDLTGAFGNSATGVQQKISTQPGATYTITFYVGNTYDPNGELGIDSTVHLFVDGADAGTFVNSSKKGANTMVWQKFSTDFVAQNTKTTIAFVNGDPSSDNCNGLDGISVALAAAP